MEDLGEQERAVLDLVKANPFAGQQEIAGMLGLARSTVAAHIVQLMQKGYILGRGYVLPSARRIACVGGAVLDRKYRAAAPLVEDTSNPVAGMQSSGGVGRNVAENLARLGTDVSFLSVVGNDAAGRFLLAHLQECGVDTSQVMVSETGRTAEYIALLENSGSLRYGLADMAIFDEFRPSLVERTWSHIGSASWIFADCNLPADTIAALLRRKQSSRAKLAIDAVSTAKLAKLPKDLAGIDLIFMNMAEAFAFLRESGDAGSATLEDARRAASMLQAAGAAEAVVSLGAEGIAIAALDGHATIAAAKASPVDITGAGDAMVAATLHGLIQGENTLQAARLGSLAGTLTTECATTVHPALSTAFLEANRVRMSA